MAEGRRGVVPAPGLKADGYISEVHVGGVQRGLSRRAGPESIERHPDVGVAFLGWKPEDIGPASACKAENMWFCY